MSIVATGDTSVLNFDVIGEKHGSHVQADSKPLGERLRVVLSLATTKASQGPNTPEKLES